MPPASKALAEEGAAIVSFKIVRDGVFQVGGWVGWVGWVGGVVGMVGVFLSR